MRLGLFMMPLHPPRKDYHQMLEEDLEAVIHADRWASTTSGSASTSAR